MDPEDSAERELDATRRMLRIECAELGDNDWPDDLHLADVVEKHLCNPAHERIRILEEQVRHLRGVLSRAHSGIAGLDLVDTFENREERGRVLMLLWQTLNPPQPTYHQGQAMTLRIVRTGPPDPPVP